MPADSFEPTPALLGRRVIARTMLAWQIAPASPHEVARRAPHGHVPARIARRLRAATSMVARPTFAHSW